MRNANDLPIYVTDTHPFYWYRRDPSRLGPGADAVFRLAAAGEAHIVVPAIVVAELFYLTQKLGASIPLATIFTDISHSTEFVFSSLGREQLEAMEEIKEIPEMHDRLIAAEALVHQAPVITNDPVLRQAGIVQVIW